MERKKILLVDDSSTILMMERMILMNGPFDLVIANDGAEALEKARSEKPDLILLDRVMPRMDGITACKNLRSDPATQEIPIIMVTTKGEDHDVAAGIEAGCSAYVTKPIDAKDLLAKVNTLLGL
jgi:CheY-like chemotaxis protein